MCFPSGDQARSMLSSPPLVKARRDPPAAFTM
jgi:hypothetical protein